MANRRVLLVNPGSALDRSNNRSTEVNVDLGAIMGFFKNRKEMKELQDKATALGLGDLSGFKRDEIAEMVTKKMQDDQQITDAKSLKTWQENLANEVINRPAVNIFSNEAAGMADINNIINQGLSAAGSTQRVDFSQPPPMPVDGQPQLGRIAKEKEIIPAMSGARGALDAMKGGILKNLMEGGNANAEKAKAIENMRAVLARQAMDDNQRNIVLNADEDVLQTIAKKMGTQGFDVDLERKKAGFAQSVEASKQDNELLTPQEKDSLIYADDFTEVGREIKTKGDMRKAAREIVYLNPKEKEDFYKGAEVVGSIEELKKLTGKALKADKPLGAIYQGVTQDILGRFMQDADARAFKGAREALLSKLSRRFGEERGALSNKDIERIGFAVPDLYDTREVAAAKWKVFETLSSFSEDIAKRKILGKGVPSQQEIAKFIDDAYKSSGLFTGADDPKILSNQEKLKRLQEKTK